MWESLSTTQIWDGSLDLAGLTWSFSSLLGGSFRRLVVSRGRWWVCVRASVCVFYDVFSWFVPSVMFKTHMEEKKVWIWLIQEERFFIEVIFKSNVMFFLLFLLCLCSGAFSYNQITFGNQWFPVHDTFLSLLRSFIEDVLTSVSNFVVFCAQSSIFIWHCLSFQCLCRLVEKCYVE